MTTDRPRPRGRSVRRWDPGRRPDLEKTNSPAPRGAGRLLLAAGACACACARPRPSLVFLAPAPPSPSVQRLSGCHWQAQAAGVLAASGWAGLGLRAHIASSQSPVAVLVVPGVRGWPVACACDSGQRLSESVAVALPFRAEERERGKLRTARTARDGHP